MIPALDPRLQTVLNLIEAESHVDIGSDHAHLPIRLVQAGRVRRCVVVEVNAGPLAHALHNVRRAGLSDQIEVRLGDGFQPLAAGEVHSASLTGMGAGTIRRILEGAGEKLVAQLVLQPNDSPRPLREWALANRYHLTAEALAEGFWTYPVLRLEQRAGADPAYSGLPREAALRYGPRLLREAGPLLRRQVWADIVRLTPLAAAGRPSEKELAEAKLALAYLQA